MRPIKRSPDFGQFMKVLRRQGRPAYLPFYEHLASPGFMASRLGVSLETMTASFDAYWTYYVQFWLGLGYDCIPMEVALNCPLGHAKPGPAGSHSVGSEARVIIASREDYDRYPWPPESAPLDFKPFEKVAGLLPAGVKIVGGVCAGPYEWASTMLGTVGMAYLLADDPELVGEVFQRIGNLHVSAVRQLASMPGIGALRQGDDLGFKTSTFLGPDLLRKLVFPIYTRMAAAAHAAGKPFILHSCGNLNAVYDDLIDTCRIDAKHSFEDIILPVAEFKQRYGMRITPLGGLDVDKICRLPEAELRAYVRETIEACFHDGYWALGTGNSLTDYMPVEKYLMVLDEGLRAGGGSP